MVLFRRSLDDRLDLMNIVEYLHNEPTTTGLSSRHPNRVILLLSSGLRTLDLLVSTREVFLEWTNQRTL